VRVALCAVNRALCVPCAVCGEHPSDTLQLGFCQLADLVEINQHKRLREAGVIDALVSMTKVIKSLPPGIVCSMCVLYALCFERCTARFAFCVLRFAFCIFAFLRFVF
jgi:hypothetical protein